ncbi:FAD/NAD(P)-binding protein [Nonomuraea sp. NPDC050404]|uniref:FAD/NAD(P)-binding protein n=1 Tax=Nonomuraea sp. NPDC050404 TaxID=3155783 RepID=UPI0033F73620
MHIAIIGGGSAAVGLLDALAIGEAHPEAGEVTVFEPAANLWRGRPYGPDLDSVLVNSPPAIMSIRGSDPGHYASWLGPERTAAHLDGLLGQPLVPRSLYGEYLTDTAEAALSRLREQGWRTRIVTSKVVAVTRDPHSAVRTEDGAVTRGSRSAARTGDGAVARGAQLVLRTGDGHEYAADQVVVCVGVGTPQDHYGLAGAPGFVGDPYPLAYTLDQVPAGAGVAVIGSGLTAVDVVVSLAARGHTGPITLVSRSGMLPAVWQRPLGHQRRHLTVERVEALRRAYGVVTLDDLTGLLRAELDEVGEDLAPLTAELLSAGSEPPAERLRRQLAAVDDPAIARRVLQESAHAVGAYAWRLLPEPDRDRLRRYSRLAVGVASPMVPVNAVTLLRLFDSGQLSVVAGVSKVEALETGLQKAGLPRRAAEAELQEAGLLRGVGGFRVRGDGADLYVDVAINAVNPPPQAVPRTAEPLVTSLLADGLAALHPAGGLVPADPRLHVLGDMAGGGSFITSGIPGIAAQGVRVAGELTGQA